MIYFAQFLITGINQEQRRKAIDRLKLDTEDALTESEEQFTTTLEQQTQAQDTQIAEIHAALERAREATHEALTEQIAALRQEAAALEVTLQEADGKSARRNIALAGEVIVRYTEPVEAAAAIKTLHKSLQAQENAAEKQAAAEVEAIASQAAADEQDARDASFAPRGGAPGAVRHHAG